MKKFFLYDKAENTMVTPSMIADENGQMTLNVDAKKSTSLDEAYLFTDETLAEMGIQRTPSMIEIPVTQNFLNDIPWRYTDTAPQFDADDKIPVCEEDTPVVLLNTYGFYEYKESGEVKIHNPDISEAVPTTIRQMKENGLEDDLSECLAINWENGYQNDMSLDDALKDLSAGVAPSL